MRTPAIAIFDVGKTNKKVLVFDEGYKLLHEESVQLAETTDEDGFPCEDVNALTKWVQQKFSEILSKKDIDVKAVNFSAYGASLVCVDAKGNVITPLYNYLKPYPENLKKQFYDTYGGEDRIARETSSPVLGSLNSGMQLYRLKYEQRYLFEKMAYAFHLPQYLSYILADFPATEMTSVGCHTSLWDFNNHKYHHWVQNEGIDVRFPFIVPSSSSIPTTFNRKEIEVGVGLHDSSAALIPYLSSFAEPFALISTGTWSITLNPFNHTPLTDEELKQDCLCYLSYEGKPVKASRLFLGHEHEQEVKKLSSHFKKGIDHYQAVKFDDVLHGEMRKGGTAHSFTDSDICQYKSYEEAYHYLIFDLVQQQAKSTKLVLHETTVKKIFVDGGFAKNKIFMTMLASEFLGYEVYAATISQASALGAALAIHKSWNNEPLPNDIIKLNKFSHGSQK